MSTTTATAPTHERTHMSTNDLHDTNPAILLRDTLEANVASIEATLAAIALSLPQFEAVPDVAHRTLQPLVAQLERMRGELRQARKPLFDLAMAMTNAPSSPVGNASAAIRLALGDEAIRRAGG